MKKGYENFGNHLETPSPGISKTVRANPERKA